MSAISFSGGTCSLSSSPLTVFGSRRWVTASKRSRPRVADSSICRTFRLVAASWISLGRLTCPYSRRMPLNSAVPTAFSNPRMRASRSSPEPEAAEPFDFAGCA